MGLIFEKELLMEKLVGKRGNGPLSSLVERFVEKKLDPSLKLRKIEIVVYSSNPHLQLPWSTKLEIYGLGYLDVTYHRPDEDHGNNTVWLVVDESQIETVEKVIRFMVTSGQGLLPHDVIVREVPETIDLETLQEIGVDIPKRTKYALVGTTCRGVFVNSDTDRRIYF